MGIYSAKAAEMLKESEVEFNPNAAGLLEFAVNSQRADQAMFDAMLEIDFREAYQAKGTIVTEANEEAEAKGNAVMGIIKKIGAAIEKVIQTIMLAIEKLKQTVLEKTKLDKKIIGQYHEIDMEKVKANMTDKDKGKKITIYKANAALTEAINTITKKYYKENFNNYSSMGDSGLTTLKNEIEEKTKGVTDSFDAQFESIEIEKITQEQAKNLYDVVNGGYSKMVTDVIGGKAKETLDHLKKSRSDFLKLKGDLKKNDRSSWNNIFALINYCNSSLTKLVNFGTSSAVRAIAEARKGYVTLGMIQKRSEKKAEGKEEKKDEKAVNASFTYDDAFEFAFEVATDNMFMDFTLG